MTMFEAVSDFIFCMDAPEAADALVIPGNIYVQPALRAAGLYHAGFARRIYVSGRFSKGLEAFPGPAAPDTEGEADCKAKDPDAGFDAACLDAGFFSADYATEADMIRAVLLRCGVPDEAIVCDHEATFTYENALNVRRLMALDGLDPQKVIICCQAYHARRCRSYFEYVFEDQDVRFLVCPADTMGITKENWMVSPKGRGLVFGELRRLGEQFSWMLGE